MRAAIPTAVLYGIGAVVLAPMALLVFSGLDDIEITCSLYHDKPLDEWWAENNWKFPNITLEEFRQYPFSDGLTQIDGEFVEAKPEEVQVGDVMAFRTFSEPPVIAHRVIRKWTVNWTHNWIEFIAAVPHRRSENLSETYFSTIGDNWFQQPFEREIEERQVVGKFVPIKKPNRFFGILTWLRCNRAETGLRIAQH